MRDQIIKSIEHYAFCHANGYERAGDLEIVSYCRGVLDTCFRFDREMGAQIQDWCMERTVWHGHIALLSDSEEDAFILA